MAEKNAKNESVNVDEETKETKTEGKAVDADGNDVDVDELGAEDKADKKDKFDKKGAKTAKEKKPSKFNKHDRKVAAIGFGLGAGLALVGGGALLWRIGKKNVMPKSVVPAKAVSDAVNQAAQTVAQAAPSLEETVNYDTVHQAFQEATSQVVKETVEG